MYSSSEVNFNIRLCIQIEMSHKTTYINPPTIGMMMYITSPTLTSVEVSSRTSQTRAECPYNTCTHVQLLFSHDSRGISVSWRLEWLSNENCQSRMLRSSEAEHIILFWWEKSTEKITPWNVYALVYGEF